MFAQIMKIIKCNLFHIKILKIRWLGVTQNFLSAALQEMLIGPIEMNEKGFASCESIWVGSFSAGIYVVRSANALFLVHPR